MYNRNFFFYRILHSSSIFIIDGCLVSICIRYMYNSYIRIINNRYKFISLYELFKVKYRANV